MLYIDNTEVKRFTEQLRNMHRSNLPIVIRQTLNDMAFDVKKNTLLKFADKEFILRNPAFFKRYSGVDKANGWDINKMQSQVGITPKESTAARQLTKQEFGGTIPKRSMIYMNQARTGGSKSKRVRKQNYIGTKGIVKGKPSSGRTRKSNFVAQSIVAFRENKYLLWNKKTLFDIKSVNFSGTGKNRGVKVDATPIADYEKNRSVNFEASPFVRPASEYTFKKQTGFYVKNAKKRFEKALK